MNWEIESFAFCHDALCCLLQSVNMLFFFFGPFTFIIPLWPLQTLLICSWKSIFPLFMHSSCFHTPSCPLPTHPPFLPSSLSSIPSALSSLGFSFAAFSLIFRTVGGLANVCTSDVCKCIFSWLSWSVSRAITSFPSPSPPFLPPSQQYLDQEMASAFPQTNVKRHQ